MLLEAVDDVEPGIGEAKHHVAGPMRETQRDVAEGIAAGERRLGPVNRGGFQVRVFLERHGLDEVRLRLAEAYGAAEHGQGPFVEIGPLERLQQAESGIDLPPLDPGHRLPDEADTAVEVRGALGQRGQFRRTTLRRGSGVRPRTSTGVTGVTPRPGLQNRKRTSPMIVRFMMSPKTCCWMSSLPRFVPLSDVVTLPPAHFTPTLALTIVYPSVKPA